MKEPAVPIFVQAGMGTTLATALADSRFPPVIFRPAQAAPTYQPIVVDAFLQAAPPALDAALDGNPLVAAVARTAAMVAPATIPVVAD